MGSLSRILDGSDSGEKTAHHFFDSNILPPSFGSANKHSYCGLYLDSVWQPSSIGILNGFASRSKALPEIVAVCSGDEKEALGDRH
jgi:hypothetical protein